MKQLEGLEKSLNDVFGKSAPQLPKGFKDFIVKIVPWLTLLGGLLGLLTVYNIFRWVSTVDELNNLTRSFGVVNDYYEWSIGLYIAVAFLLVTSILYLVAFSPLRKMAKKGWDYLFYAFLLNVISNVVVAFTDYGNAGSIFSAAIGFVIGAYFLFQIRDYYLGKAKVDAATPPPKASTKSKS